MARKRKPGGGRKPKGDIQGKSATLTTRITPETRAALDRAAEEANVSVSQMAERLLKAGLARRKERSEDRPIKALCYLIQQIAIRIGMGRFAIPEIPGIMDGLEDTAEIRQKMADSRNEWRTDPFVFRAFTLTVIKLLNAIAPSGDPLVSPFPAKSWDRQAARAQLDPALLERTKTRYSSPEAMAEDEFYFFWKGFVQARAPSERVRELISQVEGAGDILLDEMYGFVSARRDLGLDKLGAGDQQGEPK